MSRQGSHSTAAALLAVVVAASGCATDYVARTRGVRDAYERYDYQDALERLDRSDPGAGPDALLYHLDRGMILHAAGRWEESLTALHAAEALAARLDIVSVSEEARVLLSNEREKAYRGEDFERLLINVLKALDYAALGRDEAALVEVRRANERLRVMVQEEEKPYQQLAVARYLAGVLWESAGEDDSAVIDYRAALERNPELGALVEPLLRLARKTGRTDLYEDLAARFPEVAHPPLGPGEGQLVVLVEAGRSPEKTEVHQDVHHDHQTGTLAVPDYRPRSWGRSRAWVEVDGEGRSAVTVTSVEAVARQHLQERVGRMVAKSLAGTAVKAGVAAGVGAATKSEELGWLTFWLLMLAQQPDLRSWLSLPAEFQVARFRVPAGAHQVTLRWRGEESVHPVEVGAGRIALLVVRRY